MYFKGIYDCLLRDLKTAPGFVKMDKEELDALKTSVNSYRNPVMPDKAGLKLCMVKLQFVLVHIARILQTCYEKPCIVLIDEFDAPFLKAYESTSTMKNLKKAKRRYKRMTNLLITILKMALKVVALVVGFLQGTVCLSFLGRELRRPCFDHGRHNASEIQRSFRPQ